MSVAIKEAAKRSLHGITLTTDRSIPFNAPFYCKLGFQEIAESDLSPFLASILQADVANGLSAERRVAMRLLLSHQ
ncbi:hypothetical protein [Oryzifoliimicrobium ureilyticus]|uniref:hypothetical protein n=1 Tax=Oryzifoliimicrobium ureilyticus TaxID=3113724 RepID=UPI0030762C29